MNRLTFGEMYPFTIGSPIRTRCDLFPTQLSKCLHYAGVVTLDDLSSKIEADILRQRNCGRQTLNKLHTALYILRGLSVKEAIDSNVGDINPKIGDSNKS